MSSNCDQYPISKNYNSLKHTYVNPIQYEAYTNCNQYPVAHDYSSLKHTYVNPKQYEAYTNCNQYPVADDYSSLKHTYVNPIQYEAYTNCNQYPVSDDYNSLKHTYVNPKQYEAYNNNNPTTTKIAGFEIPTANLSSVFEVINNTKNNKIPIASTSVQQVDIDKSVETANNITKYYLNQGSLQIPPIGPTSFKSSNNRFSSKSILPANLNTIAYIKKNLNH